MIIECPNNKAEKLVFGKIVSKYDSEGTSTYEASRLNFKNSQEKFINHFHIKSSKGVLKFFYKWYIQGKI